MLVLEESQSAWDWEPHQMQMALTNILSPTKKTSKPKIDSKRFKISLQQSIYTEDLFWVV